VPKSIVRVAKKQLGELEQAQAGRHPQGDLFSATPPVLEVEYSPALDALEDLKPDELSPKEALAALYRLQDLLRTALRK